MRKYVLLCTQRPDRASSANELEFFPSREARFFYSSRRFSQRYSSSGRGLFCLRFYYGFVYLLCFGDEKNAFFFANLPAMFVPRTDTRFNVWAELAFPAVLSLILHLKKHHLSLRLRNHNGESPKIKNQRLLERQLEIDPSSYAQIMRSTYQNKKPRIDDVYEKKKGYFLPSKCDDRNFIT